MSESQHKQSYARPLPVIDTVSRGFWDQAREKRLAVQACRKCGDAHFPGSPVCPECLSDEQDWKPVSGAGILESWIEVYRAYWPGFNDALPYNVCLVRLPEGPVLISNLVGDTTGAKRGAAVHVVFEQATDEVTIPKFALD
jgi:uncharacterized protein